MCLPLLVAFFSYFVQTQESTNELAIQQFFIFVRNDVLLAQGIYEQNDVLYFQLITGETATLEQYRNQIRRRVDQKGHEVYLRDIDSFSVEALTYGVNIIIMTSDGERYEKSIAFYE